MRCAKPPTPRTTKATVRFGSSWSPAVTSLVARPPAPVAEPASRPARKPQPCCTSKSPRFTAGGFCCVTPKTAADGPKTYTNYKIWIAFGFDECLDQASLIALSSMLDLMRQELDFSRGEALTLASLTVD